jgi:glycogen debranching enzyme
MAALRLPLKGTDHMVFVPAAGLPWFVALFGRDTLIVSLQTMIVYPEFAAGALEVLAEYQATERDDYRDAEPGKILHELRYGELAHFKLIPHTTAPPMRRRYIWWRCTRRGGPPVIVL